MKMRKLLAVVLAVTLAISAMALSAFATEYETYTIPMYNNLTTTTKTATYSITVPLYGLYGYLVAGDTITLNLPTTFASDDDGDGVPDYTLPVSYTLTIGGVTVALQGTSDYDTVNGTDISSAYGTYTQDVTVGYVAQNYTLVSWANFEAFAMIPQSTAVASSVDMTITATVDWSAYSSDPTCESWEAMETWWPVWGMYCGQQVIAEINSATQGTTEVYGYSLSVSKGSDSSTSTNNVVIIADTTTDTTISDAEFVNTILYWDHTLANRALMLNAASTEGATAELVVNLADSIYGYALYTLTADAETYDASQSYSGSSLWYGTTGIADLYSTVVDTYTLSGFTTNTLEFDVDTSLLYNSTYGLYNGSMYITQLLTGTSSDVSTKYYTNSGTYALEATSVELILSFPVADSADDSDTIDVTDPIEPTDTETEEDGTDTTETETPAETTTDSNPTTGIVLALVPMAVAAAAAVASKRR